MTELVEVHSPTSTVFPIHGNHEFDPMNTQDFKLEKDPVIEIVSTAWRDWLTDEAHQEYLTNSFYSMKAADHPDSSEAFKKKMGKTRIIGYNSQNCYNLNFFLYGEKNDPNQQLEWLENLLRKMEQDGEIGIFMSHMSPGTSDCLSVISSKLRVLFDRFQHILRINLFGHTHQEEFEVIRAYDDGKPIGVNHLSASMTTFLNQNPAFRIITLDAETMLPIKIETQYFDIKKANREDEDPRFVKHHDILEAYGDMAGISDLSPESFLKLSDSFKFNEELALTYKKNMYSSGPRADGVTDCNAHCRNMLACKTGYSVYSDARNCLSLKDKITDIWSLESLLFDFLEGEWVTKQE